MSLHKENGDSDNVKNTKQTSYDVINELLDDKTIDVQDPKIINLEDSEVLVLDVFDSGLSETCYNPFRAMSNDTAGEKQSSTNNTVDSRIGPFADNRPICECETISQLMANNDARFLLSLLPDMAEMNNKQKSIFKNKALLLIDSVLTDCRFV